MRSAFNEALTDSGWFSPSVASSARMARISSWLLGVGVMLKLTISLRRRPLSSSSRSRTAGSMLALAALIAATWVCTESVLLIKRVYSSALRASKSKPSSNLFSMVSRKLSRSLSSFGDRPRSEAGPLSMASSASPSRRVIAPRSLSASASEL